MRKPSPVLVTGLLSAFLVAALAAFSVLSASGHRVDLTDTEREWLEGHEDSLRVSSDPEFAPVAFFDRNGEPSGISADILRLVEKRLGISVRPVRFPSWPDVVLAAKDREIDVVSCMASNAERRSYMDFTKPYLSVPTVVVTGKKQRDMASMADLSGKRVAISAMFGSWEYFTVQYPKLVIVSARNDLDALLMVSLGQVDAAVSDIPTISHLVETQGISNLRVSFETEYVWEYSFASRNDMPILSGILEKAVASIDPRERNAIFDRWISVEYKLVMYNSRFWLAIAVFACVASVIAFLFSAWRHSLAQLVRSRTSDLSARKASLEALVSERTRALEEANDRLTELATTDPLTGAYNRRYFFEAGEREFLRVRRHGKPYSVIMLDLDHFKEVNDRHGHAKGDEVLKAVVERIKPHIRSVDVLGRLGGEEFYVLLVETEIVKAEPIAERFRASIEAIDTLVSGASDGSALRITASLGVCQYEETDHGFSDGMIRVDAAMYKAKREGRNRVMTAEREIRPGR